MNWIPVLFVTIVFMTLVTPFCMAAEDPTVDINATMDEMDSIYLDLIINNPGQTDLYLTGFDLSVSDPVGINHLSLELKTPLLLKAGESITHRSKYSLFWCNSLKRFYSTGSADISVTGSLSLDKGSSSFGVPFSEETTIFLETEADKHLVSPDVTDIEFYITKLSDEDGKVREVITTTNISIYNPNDVALIVPELECEVFAMDKEGEKLKLNSTLPGSSFFSNKRIEPMDTFVYSSEQRTSDSKIIRYFSDNKTKYIKVRGTASLIPNETGWAPSYFDSKFNTVITIGDESKDYTNQTDLVSAQERALPGFEATFTILSLLVVCYIHLLNRK